MSQPRHCSKDVQLVPNAVHHSGNRFLDWDGNWEWEQELPDRRFIPVPGCLWHMICPKNPSDSLYSTRYQRFCQGDYVLPSNFKCNENKAALLWQRGTFRFEARWSPNCQCVASTTKRLEKTLRAPVYHLTEGEWCQCTVGKHRYPVGLEESQWLCSLVTCHWHGNTPLGAHHWRETIKNLFTVLAGPMVRYSMVFSLFICNFRHFFR